MEMFGSFRVVLMAILIASPLLHAAEPVYVEFFDARGNLLDGPVRLKGYRGSLEGLSFLHIWMASLDPVSGQSTGGASPTRLAVTVNPSAATPVLIATMVKGGTLSKAIFHFVRMGVQGALEDFYTATITSVRVVGHWTVLPNAAARVTQGLDLEETFDLIFGDITIEASGNTILIDQVRYIPGDANGDLTFDISDPIKILSYLFLGDKIRCPLAGDVNSDGTVDISDGISMLSALFSGGPGPPPPFPACGPVPPGQSIPCAEAACDGVPVR